MHIHYHYPRPEPFSPYPPGGQVPDYAKWMKEQLALKQDKLTFDILPVEGSLNPVTSGGIYLALAAKASLVNGKVPAEQLPSYVDDVLEFASREAFPDPGESGILYVAQDQNLVYRWTGTTYVAVVGKIDIDTTVTRLSSNPVASLGIWAAIWGSLSTTPTGYTSLYDWTYDQLDDKLNKSGDTMTGGLTIKNASLSLIPQRMNEGTSVVMQGETVDVTTADPVTQTFNHRTLTWPSATGTLAITADATLTLVYSEWVCNPAKVQWGDPSAPTEIEVAVYKPEDYYQDVWALNSAGSHGTTFMASQPYDPAATSLTFSLPSGEFITRTVTATRAVIGYTLGAQSDKPLQPSGDYLSVEGGNVGPLNITSSGGGYLTIKGGDNTSTEFNSTSIVLPDGTELTFPQTGIVETLALVSQVYAAVQQIAPAWVSGTPYTANTLVTYNGVVYRCKANTVSPHTTTPDADATHWEVKPVSELFLLLTGGEMAGDIKLTDNSAEFNGYQAFVKFANPIDNARALIGFAFLDPDTQNAIYFTHQIGSGPEHTAVLPHASGTLALAAPNPTAGNLAKLDAQGNPVDSGVKPSDFAPATKTVTVTATETMLPPDCFPIRYTDGGTTVELSADDVEFTPQFVLRVKGATSVISLARFALPSGGQTIADYSQHPDITFGGRAPTTGVWPAYLREGETYSVTYPVVYGNDIAPLAPLASPAFTGAPTAPTPTAGDNTTKVATTEFVQAAVAGVTPNLDYVMRVDPETGGIYYTTPDTNA